MMTATSARTANERWAGAEGVTANSDPGDSGLDDPFPMQEMWDRFQGSILGRVAVVEEASARLSQGSLDEDLRTKAVWEAHKLAGLVGTFGLMEATDLARSVERMLERSRVLDDHDAAMIAEWVTALRGHLERGPGVSAPG